MPLANHNGMVAGGLQEMADCGAFGRDEVFASAVENAAGKPGTPVVTPGEQAVAGGSADGAWRVRIQKGEAFVSHPLQVGRLDFAIGIGGRDVSNAKVIGHHENNVGQIVCRRGNAKAGGKGDAGGQKEPLACRETLVHSFHCLGFVLPCLKKRKNTNLHFL